MAQINNISSAMYLIIVAVAMLIYTMGVSCLAGIAVLFFVAPIQAYCTRLAQSIRREIAAATDTRVRFMNELLQGIRVIKVKMSGDLPPPPPSGFVMFVLKYSCGLSFYSRVCISPRSTRGNNHSSSNYNRFEPLKWAT
jgi:hypothetical protein